MTKSALPVWLRPRAPKKDELPEFTKGIFKVNYLHLYILIAPIVLLAIGLYTTPLLPYTAFWAGICYTFSGLGITAGYHRLFSHCAYKASRTFKVLVALWGAGALQGSIKWWARNHRIHHRYVDTDKDPYNALRGFLYTHVGWMVMDQNYEILGRVDVEDLRTDKLVQWQHKNYVPLALIFGFFIPIAIPAYFWGDFWGGVFYAGALKTLIVHHSTFLINSIAHFQLPGWIGSLQTYSDGHTTFDNWFVALLTNGEGYHNFHHEFPQDYRNGVRAWHWDPTKWLIRVAYVLGTVTDLVRYPGNEITKARLMQRYYTHQRQGASLLNRLDHIDHGKKESALPTMSRGDVTKACEEGATLLIIDGGVYDYGLEIDTGAGVTHVNSSRVWFDAHPGGKRYLELYKGKDATEAFRGKVYAHTLCAEQLLAQLAVARIEEE